MQLNRNDIIKDGENIFSVFCVMGSAICGKPFADVYDTSAYEMEEILKYYRKIEIMKNESGQLNFEPSIKNRM